MWFSCISDSAESFQGQFELYGIKLSYTTEDFRCGSCITDDVKFGFIVFQTVQKLFKNRYGKDLSFTDRMEFVNLWFILIIINDCFTIIGSAFKIRLEIRVRVE